MENKNDLVSIITPLYNGERFVSTTIDSVLAQTYSYWEMIIVNDGSTDHSAEIVQSYVDKDSRIKLYTQLNAGSAAARNNGIRRAKGRYIAMLDSDDLWDADYLQSQIDFMQSKNASVICAAYRYINEENKEILSPYIPNPIIPVKQMRITNRVGCLTGMYDTEKHGKHFFREELRSLRDDYAFWLELAEEAGNIYGNQSVIASYRVWNSFTGNKFKLVKAQFLFYYKYQQLGLLQSIYNLLYWGLRGIKKFYLTK